MYRERLFKLAEKLREEGFEVLAAELARIAEENARADCEDLVSILRI